MERIFVIQVFTEDDGWCNDMAYVDFALAEKTLAEDPSYTVIDDEFLRIDTLEFVEVYL